MKTNQVSKIDFKKYHQTLKILKERSDELQDSIEHILKTKKPFLKKIEQTLINIYILQMNLKELYQMLNNMDFHINEKFFSSRQKKKLKLKKKKM